MRALEPFRRLHHTLWERRVDRPAVVAAGVGLFAVLAFFATTPRLPFQDLPNHELILRLGRHFANGATSPFFESRHPTIFGYSLYIGLHRALAFALESNRCVALITTAGAIAFPIAVARLSRALGGSGRWAFALSVPFILAWHVRMGFVPYSLGVDGAVLWIASTARMVESFSLRRAAWVFALASLTYLAHPLAWAAGSVGVALVWVHSRRSRTTFAAIAISMLAVFAFFTWDVAHHAFRQIPETTVTWEPSPPFFRPLTTAFAHLVTRTFSVTRPIALVPIFAIVFGTLVAIPKAHASADIRREDARHATTVYRGLFVFAAIAVFAPSAVGVAWVIGDRLAIFAAVFAIVAASRTFATNDELGPRLIVAAATLTTLGLSVAETRADAIDVARISLPVAARLPPGRYLTYRLSDCSEEPRNEVWGRPDPERQLWSTIADEAAMTPYAFAFANYLPVQFQGAAYGERLRAPREWDVNELRTGVAGAACEAFDRHQVDKARRTRFDGVIVTGLPERIERIVGVLPREDVVRATPGIWLVRRTGSRSADPAAATGSMGPTQKPQK